MVPIEVKMEALGTERVGMESSRARRTRSVCVVALSHISACESTVWGLCAVPIWISHNQECYVDFVCVGEDVVAG